MNEKQRLAIRFGAPVQKTKSKHYDDRVKGK